MCLEEGTQSAWLYELLKPHVAEIVVSVPEKRRGAKDDQRDAWARADELRAGAVQTRVYKAPQQLAGLAGGGARLRLRSQRRGAGEEPPEGGVAEPWDHDGRERVRRREAGAVAGEAGWPAPAAGGDVGTAAGLGDAAASGGGALAAEEAKAHPIIRKLATAPGMGPIRTAQVVAIVGTAERFRTRQQFWSYCGLGIVTHSSADWKRGGQGAMGACAEPVDAGPDTQATASAQGGVQGRGDDGDHAARGRPAARALPADGRGRDQAGTGAADVAGAIAAIVLSMWKHQEVYDPKRQMVTAVSVGESRHEATSAGCKPAVAARERFEGEHPFVSWSPGRDGQTPNEGYAPSECRLKPWPTEAQSGAWRARIAGKRNEGFRFERVEAGRTLPAGVREASLTEPFARSGASTSSSLACARLRPLHEIARARGSSLLLTTHFSGADEAW